MSRVLITGGAGFIGSHIVDAYLARGDEVTVLDDLSTGSKRNLSSAQHSDRFCLVIGDVRDGDLVAEAVERADVVFHLAARIGLKLIVKSALKTLETNVEGTQSILRQAARYRKPILVASTSEVYGLSDQIPSREDGPIVIGSPAKSRWSYAISKALDESAALAYHREEGLPAVVVRLFNTVGPRQTAHYGMVIPRFVRQAIQGLPLTVYGDGTQTRCFGYVGDVVQGLVKLMMTPDAIGRVVNLGNPHEITIIDLAHRVIAATQSSSSVEFISFDDAYEANFEEIMRRVPNIEVARALIGFEPHTDLDGILAEVIDEQRSVLQSETAAT